MNEFQQNLYNNLMKLVQDSEAFYHQDFVRDDITYRIFNYRLASYTEFTRPSALECRGHMFAINPDGTARRLVSWPCEKFFNLHENPYTMELDLSTVNLIEDKVDGSLISTYNHGGALALKSKGSLNSEQCVDAMEWLNQPEQRLFREEIMYLVNNYFTVNMEWISPKNRIVIGYAEPTLRVLNIRNNENGKYLDKDQLNDGLLFLNNIYRNWVDEIPIPEDVVAFVNSIPAMEGIEGYVIRLASGQRVKIKTSWYLALHHTKDSINSDRRLYEAVLMEAVDDLRSLFYDDPLAIARIDKMQTFVEHKYNHLVKSVEDFYAANKHLERKEYAILGQKELDRLAFGLAMNKYLNKPVNYKQFMADRWKEFGVKDEPKQIMEE